MRVPDLEKMISDEESKVGAFSFVGFNGNLISVDDEGNHTISGADGVIYLNALEGYTRVHGYGHSGP